MMLTMMMMIQSICRSHRLIVMAMGIDTAKSGNGSDAEEIGEIIIVMTMIMKMAMTMTTSMKGC